MSKKHGDWIPHKELELVDLINAWIRIVGDSAKQALYGWDGTTCTALIADLVGFLNARETYREAPTTANRLLKDEAKAYAIDKMRVFARESVRFNPKMNEAQTHELGVSAQDTEPSPVVIPRDGPHGEAKTSQHRPGVVELYYEEPKPAGVERVEAATGISEEIPKGADKLTVIHTFSRNPLELTFPSEDRGKLFHFGLRYLGTNNQASDWTPIQSVVIP
jgi:hypothetical protein